MRGIGCGALFGVWDASPASAAAYAVTARGAARAAEKLSNTMTTNPDGKPYAHNAEQAEAHKLARAEGDGPVSNATARAYLNAYPAEPATIARLREDLEFSRRKGPKYAVVTTQEAISDALAHIAVLSSPNTKFRDGEDMRPPSP